MQLNVRDAARFLAVSEKTIYRWIKQGILPTYRVNEQYRFNKTDLLEWATTRRVDVPAVPLTTENESDGSLPSIEEALQPGSIFYKVSGTDRSSVLRTVVDLMPLPKTIDRDFLFQVLLARESLGSTAVGDGIAIPHVRNPIVLHISEPVITLCFLENPIDFNALDGKAINRLFTILSPSIRTHLHILSRLAFLLRDSGFKDAIMREASREEILKELRRGESRLCDPACGESP